MDQGGEAQGGEAGWRPAGSSSLGLIHSQGRIEGRATALKIRPHLQMVRLMVSKGGKVKWERNSPVWNILLQNEIWKDSDLLFFLLNSQRTKLEHWIYCLSSECVWILGMASCHLRLSVSANPQFCWQSGSNHLMFVGITESRNATRPDGKRVSYL